MENVKVVHALPQAFLEVKELKTTRYQTAKEAAPLS